MNSVEIINETNEKIDIDDLKKTIEYALSYEKVSNGIMNVIIINNEKIHQINKEYRGIDRPTDVISFALEDDKTFVNTDFRVLGDIYISIDKVYEQADAYGHSFRRELSFLTVHGILHLLGYDHMREEDEKVMFGKQDKILNDLGITR
ncbi:MAG: rRNA maturation RNase YbeY [Bacilli bacterium]|nr:rRNA maturation RNase YbeY [Bacilli bacterium]